MAEDWSGLLTSFQNVPVLSLNCVPPTATLFGVELSPLTAATVPFTESAASQPAAPLSPAETNAVIPCVAACAHNVPQKLFPAVPSADSHSPKLVLITLARLLFTMYW